MLKTKMKRLLLMDWMNDNDLHRYPSAWLVVQLRVLVTYYAIKMKMVTVHNVASEQRIQLF